MDFESKRYCTACWIGEHNPEHPELELIRQQVIDSVEEWKCTKWSREEGPLPDGPKPARD